MDRNILRWWNQNGMYADEIVIISCRYYMTWWMIWLHNLIFLLQHNRNSAAKKKAWLYVRNGAARYVKPAFTSSRSVKEISMHCLSLSLEKSSRYVIKLKRWKYYAEMKKNGWYPETNFFIPSTPNRSTNVSKKN